MTEFKHSIVLFSGVDGLPLEFNIQNAVEKRPLRAMIEHGGGICTHSDDAIHIVSPGTKVLNVNSGKKVISSRYIFDCVKENYLLDTSEYKIEINEMETSDLSEDSLNLVEQEHKLGNDIKRYENVDKCIDVVDVNTSSSPDLLNCPSNHAFDFETNEMKNIVISVQKEIPEINLPLVIRLECGETPTEVNKECRDKEMSENTVNTIPDSIGHHCGESLIMGQNLEVDEACEIELNANVTHEQKTDQANVSARESTANAIIVSSSQPNAKTGAALDQFDNMLLNKLHEKSDEEEEHLSQSYTVSSSADAQIPSKPSPHNTSAEIFQESAALPDSASQSEEMQQYVKNLEREVKQILQKPSPKSIQDKVVLVKYICIVKKLPPALVLQTLQTF